MNIINDMLVDKCFPDTNARAVVPAYKDKTASGNPITLTDSVERKPLGMKLYGWSKQETFSGIQLFKPEVNVLEKDGVTISVKDGIVSAQGTNTGEAAIYVCIGSALLATGEVFTVSGFYSIDNGDIECYGECGGEIVSGMTRLGAPSDKTYSDGTKYRTIQLNCEGEVKIKLKIRKNASINAAFIPSIMQSSELLPYEPYVGGTASPSPEYPQEIESAGGDGKIGVSARGKNLFDINGEIGYKFLTSENNININMVNGNVITCNADSSGTACFGAKIVVKPNTTYCFSCDVLSFGTGMGVYLGVNTDKPNKALNYVKKLGHAVLKVTTGDTDLELVFGFSTINGKGAQVTKVMLNEGTEEGDYEPYRTPQSTSIITPSGLPGIPVSSNTAGITYTDAAGQAWIADEIDFSRGKYIQRVWKNTFNGSENWFIYNYFARSGFSLPCLPSKTTQRAGYCSIAKVNTVLTASFFNVIFGDKNNIAYFMVNPFYDSTLDDKGLANWKAYLADHPVTVMTYLDTPIERDLTSAELAEYTQLYSYKPTTIIENDSGCWMDVTYKAVTSGKSKNETLRWYFKNVMPLIDDGKRG